MKKNKLSIFIILLAVSMTSFGQSFLNGSFENNTASGDQINLMNSQYDGMMSYSKAFGDLSGGGPGGGDMDIITTTTYCGAPQSGNWFVALTSGGTDAISLMLSSPLLAGSNYSLTFYDRSCDPYALGSPIKIGVSGVNDNFGSLVYTAPSPVLNGGWTQRTFSFIAPINADYITVTCDGPNSGAPWIQIDNFTIKEVVIINTVELNGYFRIFPNPASDEINISQFGTYAQIKSVRILNQLGQELYKSKFTEKINVSGFANGLYFMEIIADNEIFFTKFFKQ